MWGRKAKQITALRLEVNQLRRQLASRTGELAIARDHGHNQGKIAKGQADLIRGLNAKITELDIALEGARKDLRNAEYSANRMSNELQISRNAGATRDELIANLNRQIKDLQAELGRATLGTPEEVPDLRPMRRTGRPRPDLSLQEPEQRDQPRPRLPLIDATELTQAFSWPAYEHVPLAPKETTEL